MVKPLRVSIAELPGSRFPGGWTPVVDPGVIYSLYRRGRELFFLNQSAEVLDKVMYGSIGFVATGEAEGVAPTSASPPLVYEEVLAGQAVLLDEFDDYFDCDMYIGVSVSVVLHGKVEAFHASAKGGPGTKILKKEL